MMELPLVLGVYHFWMGFKAIFEYCHFLAISPLARTPDKNGLQRNVYGSINLKKTNLGAPKTTLQLPSDSWSPTPICFFWPRLICTFFPSPCTHNYRWTKITRDTTQILFQCLMGLTFGTSRSCLFHSKAEKCYLLWTQIRSYGKQIWGPTNINIYKDNKLKAGQTISHLPSPKLASPNFKHGAKKCIGAGTGGKSGTAAW